MMGHCQFSFKFKFFCLCKEGLGCQPLRARVLGSFCVIIQRLVSGLNVLRRVGESNRVGCTLTFELSVALLWQDPGDDVADSELKD
jgi:hypothetical protein